MAQLPKGGDNRTNGSGDRHRSFPGGLAVEPNKIWVFVVDKKDNQPGTSQRQMQRVAAPKLRGATGRESPIGLNSGEPEEIFFISENTKTI